LAPHSALKSWACRVLDCPVISGNVSLYNETNGRAILPTPAVGGVGILRDLTRRAGLGGLKAGDQLILIGETKGHLGQSMLERVVAGREEGPPPPVDLAVERRNGDFVRKLIEDGVVCVCHDLSDGGLAAAAAELALASGIGVALINPTNVPDTAFLFGEDQGRYLIAIAAGRADEAFDAAEAAGVPTEPVGVAGGCEIAFKDAAVDILDLRKAHEGWLPAYMSAPH
jgi:phosphoribosylformylglycinamidine synthase